MEDAIVPTFDKQVEEALDFGPLTHNLTFKHNGHSYRINTHTFDWPMHIDETRGRAMATHGTYAAVADYLGRGMSVGTICSSKDKFTLKTGEMIALKRLIQGMDDVYQKSTRQERTELWAAYHQARAIENEYELISHACYDSAESANRLLWELAEYRVKSGEVAV